MHVKTNVENPTQKRDYPLYKIIIVRKKISGFFFYIYILCNLYSKHTPLQSAAIQEDLKLLDQNHFHCSTCYEIKQIGLTELHF